MQFYFAFPLLSHTFDSRGSEAHIGVIGRVAREHVQQMFVFLLPVRTGPDADSTVKTAVATPASQSLGRC